MEPLCRACRANPPAVDGFCLACVRERLPAARRRVERCRGYHQARASFDLPPVFVTTAEAGERIGRRPRQIRNLCALHRIGRKVPRPMGGLEWVVHVGGIEAVTVGDTGALCEAQRSVASYPVPRQQR
ncbi:MAG TPA: hypothetical protein VNK52_14290 [Hyphomicrobiaceae bacterium]|nr:hypothetical protein [Hyphomicrobiaceae bacterium]